ncbi:hypothetical protein [Desulfovibrio sp. SGI.230]|uniref:hypothetical protein n=1 Tax=Desulfovibrio sp. SGI.230 TaxID=3420562 RepID=UPI003D051B5E
MHGQGRRRLGGPYGHDVHPAGTGRVHLPPAGFRRRAGRRAGKPLAHGGPVLQALLLLPLAQASIAGALKIVRENHLAVSDIRRLVIHTFSKAASLSREHPTHTDAAQYNITYPIAVALLDGQISGAQVLPPRIFDKDVLELADMIEVVVEERFEERFPARTFSEVCITTTDGRELRSGELEPQWEPADSPSDEELLDKFTRLTAPVFGEQECARMREAIWHAEDLDNTLDIWPRTLARHIEE